MSQEDQDDAQKTEDPTQKKLDDAHKKGDVTKSQEVNHWFMIAGATLTIFMFSAGTMGDLRTTLAVFIHSPHQLPTDPQGFLLITQQVLKEILSALALPLLALFSFALAANMVQHKPVFTVDRMIPRLNKLSLLKGLKRLFSVRALADFLKGIAKLAIVTTVVIWLILPEANKLQNLVKIEFGEMLLVLRDLILLMLIGVVIIMAFIAAADMMFQRQQATKRLRMSKQDIKDELKQSEGDPLVRARIRQIRQERARQRMMAAVPEADVVVTNPTHFAVALKYDFETMDAPVLVAKGVDFMARKIREIATENDVPLVENPPLAQVLYATVDIDQAIPVEHYKAVAEVIGYVMRLKRKVLKSARAKS